MLQNRLCVCDGTGRLLQEMIIASIPILRAAQFVLVYLLPLSSYHLPPPVPIGIARATPFRGSHRLLEQGEFREYPSGLLVPVQHERRIPSEI